VGTVEAVSGFGPHPNAAIATRQTSARHDERMAFSFEQIHKLVILMDLKSLRHSSTIFPATHVEGVRRLFGEGFFHDAAIAV
jgi:hypothetical protein